MCTCCMCDCIVKVQYLVKDHLSASIHVVFTDSLHYKVMISRETVGPSIHVDSS